jgi:hypothetical protein
MERSAEAARQARRSPPSALEVALRVAMESLAAL